MGASFTNPGEAETASHRHGRRLVVRLIVLVLLAAACASAALILRTSGIAGFAVRSAAAPAVTGGGELVTTLEWPARGLALAATSGGVVWEQRSRSPHVSGLWRYDPSSGLSQRLLARRDLGRTTGTLAAAGSSVVWLFRPAGPSESTQVRAYDSLTGRVFTASRHGAVPGVSDRSVVWVDSSHRFGRAGTVVVGLDPVTDAHFNVGAGLKVRRVATGGHWVAWLGAHKVVALDRRTGAKYELTRRATAMTMDRRSVVWTVVLRSGQTVIMRWDVGTRHSEKLGRVDGAVTDLALSDQLIAWRRSANGGGVWALDRLSGRLIPVSASPATQSAPIVLDRTVYWAEKRGGDWELYRRTL